MDLVADSLLDGLTSYHSGEVAATRVCPPMRRRFTRNGRDQGHLFNADRLANRFWEYPRTLRKARNGFDVYHIVDHSYAQLVHELPSERTVVTCHDTDTFRCLVEPEQEPRSPLFRAMAKRVLTGMQKAARVTCDSAATRDALVAHDLLPANRLVVIPNGVHPALTREPNSSNDREVEKLLGPRLADTCELLHVGSTIPRKRIDVLFRTFAEIIRTRPRARLIRAGGPLTADQKALSETLGVADSIVTLPHLDPYALAAVYRRASLLMLTSEREGFGLPIVESLSCGTPVVASDLPVLREVGGEAVRYFQVGNHAEGSAIVNALLDEREHHPLRWAERCDAGVLHASRFTWREYAAQTAALYAEVNSACS